MLFEHGDDRFVLALLGHEEDDVVFARHLLGQQRMDGLYEVDRPRDVRAPFPERRDVRPVAVDEVDLPPRPRDIGAQNRSQRARAVDRSPHLSSPPRCLPSERTIFWNQPSAASGVMALSSEEKVMCSAMLFLPAPRRAPR